MSYSLSKASKLCRSGIVPASLLGGIFREEARMASPIELIAIIAGPVIGVALTLLYQRLDRSYERKLQVYQALIVWRRQVVREEWVNAFNLVPVYFARNPRILSRHKALSEHFSTPGWSEATGKSLQGFVERMELLNAELVREIGKSMNMSIPDMEILRGAYAPIAWSNREEREERTKESLLQLLEGESAIQVVTRSAQDT